MLSRLSLALSLLAGACSYYDYGGTLPAPPAPFSHPYPYYPSSASMPLEEAQIAYPISGETSRHFYIYWWGQYCRMTEFNVPMSDGTRRVLLSTAHNCANRPWHPDHFALLRGNQPRRSASSAS